MVETYFQEKGHIHPLIVHFPIALYFVAPVFMLIGWISEKVRLSMFISAAVLLLLAGLSLQFAYVTGEAASEYVPRLNAVLSTLGEHDSLAHQCKTWFFSLTAAWLALLVGVCFMKKIHLPILHISMAIFLGLYLFALNILSLTAHHGGKLVHKYGVHSQIFDTKMPGPDKKKEPAFNDTKTGSGLFDL